MDIATLKGGRVAGRPETSKQLVTQDFRMTQSSLLRATVKSGTSQCHQIFILLIHLQGLYVILQAVVNHLTWLQTRSHGVERVSIATPRAV